MPKFWAMGVSASGAATELADQAKAHALARDGMILKQAEDYAQITGKPLDEALAFVQATVDGARRRLKLAGGEQMPNLADHGVAAPVTINGERFSTVGVEYRRGGDRVATVTRPIGGGRFETKRVRMCVDGGERTRVVAEVR